MTSARGHAAGRGSRVDLAGVGKRYVVGEVEIDALIEVDLHVEEGAFLVILGPSGCVIGALDTATAGSVGIGGRDVTRASRAERFAIRRRTVSFVFQSFNLFPGLSALENVQFGADVAGRDRASEVARDALERVGLGARRDHFPHQLSGGEQQRVAIARALATGNPILLADEPTGELDFRTGIQILELLRQQADAGTTVLVVTHNREIARVADRVVELSSGRVVSDGPPVGGRAAFADLRW
jgi:putative ABC transport system ATP-binding protein